MNSETFFEGIGKDFKNLTGIYVLKAPFQYKNTDIFKVGYAYQSLYKRIRDYKTAYGPVNFEIYCVYEIPQRILGAPRTMYALATERQLHLTLHQDAVMKNVENDKLEGEWFYNIDNILETIRVIRQQHISQIKGAENWKIKIVGGTQRLSNYEIKIADIKAKGSSFNNIQVRPKSTRNKPSRIYLSDTYNTIPNPSRNFKKDMYEFMQLE